MEMSHLDYCSNNFLHVVDLGYLAKIITICFKVRQVEEVEEKEELVPCPGAILRAVAKILIER